MNDFERVKNATNILSIITQETNLKIKGHHLEECPFCKGHECFSIKDDQFKCFQCNEGGDVFTFLQKLKDIDEYESLQYAASLAGITLTKKKALDVRLSTKERIFIAATDYYHTHLGSNGGKLYLLEKRGHKEDVLKKMRVGWTDGGLVDILRGRKFSDTEILQSGLAKEIKDSLVDFFIKDVAIFPHFEKSRVLHFTIKDPRKKYKYQLPDKVRSRDWKFYNQDALGKYNEVIVVEGENDLLSVMDHDIHNVIGIIGQPAEYQLKALKTHCVHKHIYLWLDNDTAGKNFIRKICTSLKLNVRIITYPEAFKDPDDYIRKFDGDRKRDIKCLQEESIDYISWEIREISKLDDQEERLKALKDQNIFTAVADMVLAEKEIFIEKLITLRFSKEAIEEQIEVNHDLRNALGVYFERVPKKDADPNYIASMMFKSLSNNGRFYRDREDNVYLMYQHKIYEIAINRPFNALVKKLTSLLPTKEPGRSVWESLASEAYNSGMQIDLASWLHTDRVSDTIYINLNSPNNVLLKISSAGIEEIPNGMNKEGILLKSSGKILPVHFHPDADIKEGMEVLKDLIFDNMTCPREQRYLIMCWFISAFLLDFSPYMGLMKFSGATESGKTTTARFLSLLIYGSDHLGDPSTAAAYAVASQNPLLIIDNLESDDFTRSILKFLLLSATKGGKEKRKGGTESETTQEQPRALVLITAIEPFVKSELINRTYDIDFSFKFKSDSFVEDEVIRHLIKKRDLILSAILKFISKDILPNLEKRRDYITILKKEHKNHAKNRTDEYLALLMLMLEKMLGYIPYYDEEDFLSGVESGEKEIRTEWIEFQNSKARDTETASNNIIKLLDGLVREYMSKMKDMRAESHAGYDDEVFVYTHPEYLLELIKTKPKTICAKCHKPQDDNLPMGNGECVCQDAESGEIYSHAYIDFEATSGEVVGAFDRYCRNNGIRNPFGTASKFGARLSNDQPLLKKSGWELITKNKESLYYKTIRGNRFYKFRKTLIR